MGNPNKTRSFEKGGDRNPIAKIGAAFGKKITSIFTQTDKEILSESPIMEQLKKFVGNPPVWTLSKELRTKYKKRGGVWTKPINSKKFSGEVDYIAEKDGRGEDLYREIVDEETIAQKYQEFGELMQIIFQTRNRENAINNQDTVDEISPETINELYTSLEKIGFPKGSTSNSGYMQKNDVFNIRLFHPDGSIINMTVGQKEIKFYYYDKTYGYVPIGLPSHTKK